jgi:hypothetical protein
MNLRTTAVRTLFVTALATAATAGITGAANAAAPADTGPWPIVDASGNQRTSVPLTYAGDYAIACYAYGPNAGVVIEGRYSSGETVRRQIDQFQCNVLISNTSSGVLVEVRGVVGDFANPWHPVG